LNTEVEVYIERQKAPQRKIVQKLRETISETIPEIKEDFKMGVPWYEGKFYIVAFKDYVNVGFSVNWLTEEEKSLFEGKGNMMRHLKFHSLKEVDEARMVKLLRLVADKSVDCQC